MVFWNSRVTVAFTVARSGKNFAAPPQTRIKWAFLLRRKKPEKRAFSDKKSPGNAVFSAFSGLFDERRKRDLNPRVLPYFRHFSGFTVASTVARLAV